MWQFGGKTAHWCLPDRPGINIFPIISGKIIGWIESRVKEGIAMAVERGESAGMGAWEGGGGEKKKKKKRRPVVYEDDID